jgi:glycosyltransferase involved in cell wall biosynthesis
MFNSFISEHYYYNYNYGSFYKQAIDSALDQTYLHTEVIAVDDGSTDNSQEIITSYGNRIIPVLKENGGRPRHSMLGLL